MTSSVTFDTAELAALARDFQRAGAQSAFLSAKTLTSIARELRDDARRTAPVDTGSLRDSIKVAGSRDDRVVYTDERYGAFVEFGTADTPPQPFLWVHAPKAGAALEDELADIGRELLD